jgi:hypothetical protein
LKLNSRTAAGWAVVLFSVAAISAVAHPSEAPREILKAQENLKLSEQSRDRIAEELAALKASGKASPEVVAAYETYLARVQEIVAEHQKLLSQLKAAFNAHQKQAPAGAVSAPPGIASSPGDRHDPVDPLGELDRQFNESLAAFDEMLLKELKLIQAASDRRVRGLAEAAAEASKQAGEKGEGSSPEANGATAQTEGGGYEETGSDKGRPSTEQAETSKGRGKPGDTASAAQGAGGGGSGGSGAPASSYTPSPDDDIVARQLREAAEKEPDPELKAKLWKEYEEYKKSRAKP